MLYTLCSLLQLTEFTGAMARSLLTVVAAPCYATLCHVTHHCPWTGLLSSRWMLGWKVLLPPGSAVHMPKAPGWGDVTGSGEGREGWSEAHDLKAEGCGAQHTPSLLGEMPVSML